MCIHGKGIGQDAVLGPATTTPREARVKNLGNTKVSLRIQNKKTIVNTVSLEAHSKNTHTLEKKGSSLFRYLWERTCCISDSKSETDAIVNPLKCAG